MSHSGVGPINNTNSKLNEGEELSVLKKESGASKEMIKDLPVFQSRLSFTEVQLRDLEKMTKWEPYESAPFEQPFCCRNCCLPYFQCRNTFLCLCRWQLPIISVSFGKVLFFLIFLLIAAGVGYLVRDSLGSSGDLACLFLGLSYAFPTRNSVWLAITSTPFERVLFWHKFVAIVSVGMGIYHGVVSHKFNTTGVILVVLMGLLVIFSFWPLRKKYFECFYRFHWVLFVVAVPIALIHGAALAMIGAIFWLIDVLLRVYIVRKNFKRAKLAEITQVPPGLTKICFGNENFHYKAGQYVFLCVPAISVWEWHPFSLSSSPNEKAVSLHARVLGDWTKTLYDKSGVLNALEKVWIDGPYGNCALDVDSDEYKVFILVSGGIGITPMQSICNQLVYEHMRGRRIIKILFIWSVKDKFLLDEVQANPDAFYVKKIPSKLPFSFQPDVLVKHEHGHILESYFHLTNVRKKEDFNQGNINPQQQKLLKFGRPNLPSYFENINKIKEEHGEKNVAVLCCGPEPMMDECAKLSKKYSFDFHHETFNF